MKIFEMFAGYGGASFALAKARIYFECVGYSEIDKWAIQCYDQNHFPITENGINVSQIHNFGDCTKINPKDLPDFDLLTGGFPCQSFSVAGKGLGELDTRGTLFHEIIRIAEVKQPKYMLLENVKGLTNKPHRKTFEKILSELERIGYHVEWKVLNSKEHGIPQNRERVFFACFLTKSPFYFSWPQQEELKILLKDILEEEVDEKYYLSEAHLNRLITSTDLQKSFSKINPEVAGTMTARQYTNWKGNFILGNVNPSGRGTNGNVYGGGIAPTVTTNKGEGAKIIIAAILDSETWRKRYEQTRRVYSPDGIAPTIPTSQGGGVTPKIIQKARGFNKGGLKEVCPSIGSNSWQQNNFLLENYRIRKLTPKECFRLMGFSDQINLEGISDSQRYKLAGNGWDINLVSKIFQEMFK